MLPLTWEYPIDFLDLWFLPPRCKNPEIGRVGELTIMTVTDTDLHQAPEQTQARKFQGTIYINTNSMRYCPKWHQKTPPARCFPPAGKSAANSLHWQEDEKPNRASSLKLWISEGCAARGKKFSMNGGAGERASESAHQFWHLTETSYINEYKWWWRKLFLNRAGLGMH